MRKISQSECGDRFRGFASAPPAPRLPWILLFCLLASLGKSHAGDLAEIASPSPDWPQGGTASSLRNSLLFADVAGADSQGLPTSRAEETVVIGRAPTVLAPWENSKWSLDSPEIWSDRIASSDTPATLMGTGHMHRRYQPMIGFWWMYMNMGPNYYEGANAMDLNGLGAVRYAGKPVAMGDTAMFVAQYMPMLMMGITEPSWRCSRSGTNR
ncbi:hypothetical protein MAMC_01020 [Methylacidimicrobium cyclopophantes]|uniref:Uncharacterized protein n=1 Tax=Methylacidimicrobium cyclopophantes TaxID=1041766 RepID=A0A5E6MLG8_9BACT|nr:hypothetical protein [Methylacidimicrobium cyclopophantes]VVM06274.1 hypothetical protein MAMC_01020 [Methylacidimicrobium cyclopophantes]